MRSNGVRIAVLGYGAIGSHLLHALRTRLHPQGDFSVYGRKTGAQSPQFDASVRYITSEAELLDWNPQLAIECAGHAVVVSLVPTLLRHGADVVVASVGALRDPEVRNSLEQAATVGHSRILTVSGAIGGLDALAAACMGGPVSVRYRGTKPARAWLGTPAEQAFQLTSLAKPTTIFQGSASEAAYLYPKNANVTAAVALAGVGFDETKVELIADPAGTSNVHELEVAGEFGQFSIRLENNALPSNPKTSFLAVLSVESAIKHYLKEVNHPLGCSR